MRKVIFIIYILLSAQRVFALPAQTLSLNEAILLAVRSNPNVQSAQLSYVLQKFNTAVQRWQFSPHYSLQASATYGRNATPNYNMAPSVSLLTPIGTQISFNASNSGTNYSQSGLSLQIMQPLLRGFGMPVVEAALNNAKDSEAISRLQIEGALRGTVTSVIFAYLDMVSAQWSIEIDHDALRRAEKSVLQTEIFIKAGHKAGNELVTVRANVASARAQLENDKNNLEQTRYALLTAIGVDPNTPIDFVKLDLEKLIEQYKPPSLTAVSRLILANDIQFQVDQMTLHGPTSRNLLIAEDNTRWQLNVTANASTRGGTNTNPGAGFNSLANGDNQYQSVGLSWQLPIDDQEAKQAVMNAKIALKQAELALKQEKWVKETSAINGWHSVTSAERALVFANDAKSFQEKTYHVSYQKYLHGLIDSLELQSAQLQLIQAQQTLRNAEISYLKALVNLDFLIGHTLNTWQVAVRLQ